jgi:hypothetical protein
MAKPAPAFGAPATNSVQITFTAGSYAPLPVNSEVANNGQVYFICTQACWIWTFVNGALTNAFVGETGDHLACVPGNNGPYTPSVQNTTITIAPLPVNSQPPSPTPLSVRGTIKVGSTGEGGKKESE